MTQTQIEETVSDKLDKAIVIVKGRIPALTVLADIQKAAQAVLNLGMAKAQYAAFGKPTTEMDKELTFVLGRVRSNLGAIEMQQVTQAALHLMSAKAQAEAMIQAAKAPKAKTN